MRRGNRTALYEDLLCTFRVVFVLFVALSRRRVLFLYFSFLHLRYYVSFHTPYIFLLRFRSNNLQVLRFNYFQMLRFKPNHMQMLSYSLRYLQMLRFNYIQMLQCRMPLKNAADRGSASGS